MGVQGRGRLLCAAVMTTPGPPSPRPSAADALSLGTSQAAGGAKNEKKRPTEEEILQGLEPGYAPPQSIVSDEVARIRIPEGSLIVCNSLRQVLYSGI